MHQDADRSKFAQLARDEVKAAGFTEVQLDEEQFAVTFTRAPGEPPGFLFLENLWRACEDLPPQEHTAAIRRMISVLTHSPKIASDWAAVKPQLRPVLRPATFGLAAPLHQDNELLWRPALPYLIELVVVDLPDTMAYVTHTLLAKWGMTGDEVYATARGNLSHDNLWADRRIQSTPTVLHLIDADSTYLVSQLFTPGWLASAADHIGGTPVAFAPDTETVIIVPDQPDLVEIMFKSVEEQWQKADRPLSTMAYTVDASGALTVYDHGHAAARARLILAASEYERETMHLRSTSGRSPVLHAGVLAGEDVNGRIFTVATWGEGVETLLPRTEYIALMPRWWTGVKQQPIVVPFDVVVQEAQLRPETPARLERFRASQWPDSKVMARLREQAEMPPMRGQASGPTPAG